MMALLDAVSPRPADAPRARPTAGPSRRLRPRPFLAETDAEPLAALDGESLSPRFCCLARGVGAPLHRLRLRRARVSGLLRRGADRRRGRRRTAGAGRSRFADTGVFPEPVLARAVQVAVRYRRAGRIPSASSRRHARRAPRGARRSLGGRPLRRAQLSGEPFQLAVDDAEFAQMVAGGEHVFGVVAGLPDALPDQPQQRIARHRPRILPVRAVGDIGQRRRRAGRRSA